ncbi:hypothetical protein [Secundilactobacillus muriivasis]
MSGFEEGLGKENARQGISVEVVGGRFFCFGGWLPSLLLGNAAVFVVHLFGEWLGRRVFAVMLFSAPLELEFPQVNFDGEACLRWGVLATAPKCVPRNWELCVSQLQ